MTRRSDRRGTIVGFVMAVLLLTACLVEPSEPNSAAPVPVASGRLALLDFQTCLLEQSGEVLCWGEDGPARLTPGDGSLRFLGLSGGYTHGCGITTDSTAYCWGTNGFAEIGDGTHGNHRPMPVRVATDAKLVAISAGVYFTCALDAHGVALCWGWNNGGQAGIGQSGEDEVVVRPFPVQSTARFVALRGNCGLTRSGDVHCWGFTTGSYTDPYTLPGDCTSAYYHWYEGKPCLVPTPVRSDQRFKSLHHPQCAVATTGYGFCWGDGYYGNLGHGQFATAAREPVPVSGGIRFQQIVPGEFSACGLDLEGQAWCWGHAGAGKLGLGEPFVHQAVPGKVLTEQRFVSLAGGNARICGLTASDELWCWGANNRGVFGPTVLSGWVSIPVRVQIPDL